MNRPARDRQAGFALVEAIAVLALAALVLLTLLIASGLVTRNAGAAARRANDLENLAMGLSALRKDLSEAKLVRVGTGEIRSPLFHGRSGTLGLAVGSGRSNLGEGDGLVWIETQSEGDLTALVRTSAQLNPRIQSFEEANFSNPAVLIQGPWTFRFSYANAGGSALSWSGSWSNAEKLPAAIRLEVFGRGNLQPLLPPMIVPVHVNAEAVCPDQNPPPCNEEEDVEQPAVVEEGASDDSSL